MCFLLICRYRATPMTLHPLLWRQEGSVPGDPKKRAPTLDARHFLSYTSNLMKIQTQLAHYILHIMSKHDGDQPVFVSYSAMCSR